MEAAHWIISIVTSAGIVQGIFLSIAVLRRKQGSRRANHYLSFTLFFFSANIAIQEIFFSGAGFSLERYFLAIGAFQLLLGPLLFFYARILASELGAGDTPSLTHSVGNMAHLAPFLIYILLLVFFRALGGRLPAHTLSAVEKAGRFVWMALLTHTAVYLLVVMRSLYRLRATLKSRYSRIETIDLSWLRYMAFAFFATYLVLAVLLLFLSHDHPLLSEDKTVSLVLSILVYALGWRGLFQGSAPLGALERAGAAVKYARSGASADEAVRLLESVRRLMDEEKPYLDPDLSLPALAEEAGLSTGVLSRVINEAAGANFYDFVNAYRVKKAARLLADPVHAGRSILDIAFGVGFRSKSTFNTCFKKATGLTPKELRARGSSA